MSSEHNESCCPHSGAHSSVYQYRYEMDFERTIWNAALYGEVDKLQSMLSKGKDPSKPDPYGFTALHYAARKGHIDACKLLIKHGAKVNAQTNSGVTPLHRAAYQGHVEICRLLLDHMGDPSMCDYNGKNSLHKAAEQGHLNVAKLLVEQDSNLKYVKDKFSHVPQDYVDPMKHAYNFLLLFNFLE